MLPPLPDVVFLVRAGSEFRLETRRGTSRSVAFTGNESACRSYAKRQFPGVRILEPATETFHLGSI